MFESFVSQIGSLLPIVFASGFLIPPCLRADAPAAPTYQAASPDVLAEYETSQTKAFETARVQAARIVRDRTRMAAQAGVEGLADESELAGMLTPESPPLDKWMASKRLHARWKGKQHLPGTMFQGRVFDEGITELVWHDAGGRKFSALLATDLSPFGQMPVFESSSSVIKPWLLLHRAGSIEDAKDAATLRPVAASLAAHPPPPIRYVTGHQPGSAAGEAADFACLDAILDAVEMEAAKPPGTTTALPGGERLVGEVAP